MYDRLMVYHIIIQSHMDKFIPMAQGILQRTHKRFLALDTHPSLSKLVINDIVKPSNIALALSALLVLAIALISPFAIPFTTICFIFPLKATKEYLTNPHTNQWIIFYWILNAMQEVVTPFICLILPQFLWVLIRIGVAYYVVVMEQGKTLYPMIKQQLKIKDVELQSVGKGKGEVKQE